MGSIRLTRAIVTAVALSLSVVACGDDDDDPAEPAPDAGVATMVLMVGDRTVRVGADGTVSGEVGPLPFGDVPVSASFLAEDGQPHPNLPPDRYTFEVVFGDSLALGWTPGPGFTGTLTTNAAGAYTMTFRLRDTSNNGTEIFLTRMLEVDVGVRQVRILIGADTLLVPAAGSIPSTIEGLPVGPVPLRVEFLDSSGAPAPLITEEAFSVNVASSDGNIVAWTQEGPFSGTLRGVSPGVATVAVRLRSAVNGAHAFGHEITVIVGDG